MGRFSIAETMLTVVFSRDKKADTVDDHSFQAKPEKEDPLPGLSPLFDSERGFTDNTIRTVAFGSVQVREYDTIMGDHPYCQSGCPVTLDWEYHSQPTTSVDAYERIREPLRKNRRDLCLSWEERRSKIDCSDAQVRKCDRKLHRERSCNRKVLKRQQASFFD